MQHKSARFQDSVVVVTGGAGHIGRAICRRFDAEGARVVVLDNRPDETAAFAAELAAGHPVVADVTDEAAITTVVAEVEASHGTPAVWVNNVGGVSQLLDVTQATLAQWSREVHLNLNGAVNCTKAVLPGMLAQGAGVLVNVASVNGMAFFGNPAYSAAKAGLIHFTKSVATQYGPRGIRCNAVSPGTIQVDSPAWRRRLANNPEMAGVLARWYPVGRLGTPDDVAGVVAFLASADAGFVNGANLPVDGGLLAGYPVMAEEITRYDG